MAIKFIFDVDGTLTPSRGKINKEFGEWFLDFCKNNTVCLVTGSDRPKTLEQVGADIYNACHRVYNCSGSDVYKGDESVYRSDWKIPEEAEGWLREELAISKFPLRTGLHIEDRPGMCNFSVVGRNATLGERKLYAEYDRKMEERDTIATLFRKKFPDIEAVVGGETGIDIFPVGADKSQILRDFHLREEIRFYGDKMSPGGNDYPLKKVIDECGMGMTYSVSGWQDTWSKLNAYLANGA